MDKFKEIRPVVLGLIVKDHKLLVSEGHDSVKNNVFYRCLGGGIEFLEKAETALKREFQEELGIDIKVKDYVTHFENIRSQRRNTICKDNGSKRRRKASISETARSIFSGK